jgi:hypothetical protein
MSSCEKKNAGGESIVVYKTQQDYTKNIYVGLNSEKTEVVSLPGLSDIDTVPEKLPQSLVKDYYLGTNRNGEIGINSAVTSLTVETYKVLISPDSMLSLVIDFDPFVEYYECWDNSTIQMLRGANGIDTAKLNTIIYADDLDKYFERLK